MQIHFRTLEYSSVCRCAGTEGWLAPLISAHLTPCTPAEATRIVFTYLRPRMTQIDFTVKQGRASFDGRSRYRIALPIRPGADFGLLRAGLVLHEVAHVIDRRQEGRFSHGPSFNAALRQILSTTWRNELMPTRSYSLIYDRHRGPYSIMLVREIDHGGKRGKEHISDRLLKSFTAEEAHEEARLLVGDPLENVTSAFVFSETEGQFIGACYQRGTEYKTWADEREAGLELPDQRTEAALVHDPGPEPLPPVDAVEPAGVSGTALSRSRRVPAVPQAPGPPRKVGAALRVTPGKEGAWPQSAPAQEVLRTFAVAGSLTAKAAALALDAKMKEMGVAHPASLISRLKQAGLLTEVVE